MKKKIKDKNQIKKEFGVLSKKVMMAALVTSMVMTPTITASALSYNKNLISSQGTSSVESKVSILKSEGWLESASVEWSAVKGATGYNVYYKSASDSDLEYSN